MIDPTTDIDITDSAKRLIQYIRETCNSAYVVGGCVRDSLLGKTPHDWDICTSATPDRVREKLRSECIRSIDTGLQHGTITAVMNDGNYEITTFRIDGKYSDNRRPDTVKFTDSLLDDLSRRDFTINAIAYSSALGLIDPWDGLDDLHDGLIRCVGNPDDRFQEDALRILRALRFASTYGFKIEEKTAAAIHRNRELLKNISAERIQSELCKMLCGPGVLDILLEYKDVMAVIIPELGPCIGFEQNNPYHVYDVYDHIAHSVANYRGDDISIKMALLLHDIGKPECYTEDEKGGHFYCHAVSSHIIAGDVMGRLKFDNKTYDEVLDLVMYHDTDIHPSTRSVKRWLNKIGLELLDKLLVIKCADNAAHSEMAQISIPIKYREILMIMTEIVNTEQCFTIKDLAVNGNDIMSLGLPSCPAVGKVLKHLLDKVLDEELENERKALMTEAAYYIAEGRNWR